MPIAHYKQEPGQGAEGLIFNNMLDSNNGNFDVTVT